ncbi:MAG: YbaN family protein [Microthrixaceae bacterium]|nr:YbaN family protein [Microthrixaceae bacterium]
MTRISSRTRDDSTRHDYSADVHLSGSPLLRVLFLILGFLFLGLGMLGIFLPILPTTPFLLLTAACFARGSNRFYNWLLNNRVLGSLIRDWREHRSLTRRTKTVMLTLLWGVFALTLLFVIEVGWQRAAILIVPVGITAFLLRIPTRDLAPERAGS